MTLTRGRWRTLTDALELIARGGCENYTGGHRCWENPNRIKGAHYTSEAWCDACIAQDALGRDQPELWSAEHQTADEAAAAGDQLAQEAIAMSTGYCALAKVKDLPPCRKQCPTCRIHDEGLEHARRVAAEEAAKLGQPGPRW
jgi:hypothetical protein